MRNRLKINKNYLLIALIAIMIIALPLTLLLVRQNQDPRTRASYEVEAILASDNGINLINAINSDENKTNGSPYNWTNISNNNTSTGRAIEYIQANPNDNNKVYYEAAYNQGPERVYRINFPQAGTYFFYARTSGAGENADSFHYGLDGNLSGTHAGYYEGEGGKTAIWSWTTTDNDGTRSKIVVPTPGVHTFHIWMRESGTRVHKFRLITDNDWYPSNYSDWGPIDENVRGTVIVGTPTPLPGSPDLTISNAYITHNDCIQGTSFTVNNIGNASTGNGFNVGVNGKNYSVPVLAAGESKTQWVNTAAYLDTTVVVADSTNVISESNESNNTFSQFIPDPSPPPGCVGPTSTPTKSPTPTLKPPTPTLTPNPTTPGSTSTPAPTVPPPTNPPPGGCPVPDSSAGKVIMSVTVQGGTYRVWSRMKASSSTNNGFYLQFNDLCPVLVGNSSTISSSSWTWVDYQDGSQTSKINVTLPAGTHTLTLYGYEENVDVDKILMTTNLTCVPTGLSGDNCPAEGSATPTKAPTVTPTITNTPTPSPSPVPPSPTPPTSTSFPVAHWKFDGNANDSSGNGHNGITRNGATYSNGRISQATILSGQDQHIEINGLIGQPQNITISAWANLTSKDTGGSEIISLGDTVGLRLDALDGTTLSAFYWDGTGWRGTLDSSTSYLGSGWHHFVYTINTNTNTQTVYVDGNPVATSNYTGNIVYSGLGSNTFIGKHGNGGTQYDFGGQIDDVRIYNAVLSPTQIQNLYSSAPPITTSTPTFTPTPTSAPSATILKLTSVKLHGIGSGGDNANPNSGGNQNPQRTNRNIEVSIVDQNGNNLPLINSNIVFRSSSGDFSGEITLPESISSGDYLVKIKPSQYLRKQIPGIIQITKGSTTNLTQISLIAGDIDDDNALTIQDYNILVDCYSDLLPAKNCSDLTKKQSADISDDGNVNADDYNLFLRELSVSGGD